MRAVSYQQRISWGAPTWGGRGTCRLRNSGGLLPQSEAAATLQECPILSCAWMQTRRLQRSCEFCNLSAGTLDCWGTPTTERTLKTPGGAAADSGGAHDSRIRCGCTLAGLLPHRVPPSPSLALPVVVSFTTVHVRRLGRPKKYPARVLSIAHQLDLAILTVVRQC